jgi:hypothetical protein
MRHTFKTIKKKRNIRLLSVAWFLLILVIEFFSHSFSFGRTFIAESSSTKPETSVSNRGSGNSYKIKMRVPSGHGSDSDQTFCQDEVSHHDLLISRFLYPIKQEFFRNESFVFLFSNPLLNSLPPPYIPPKFS